MLSADHACPPGKQHVGCRVREDSRNPIGGTEKEWFGLKTGAEEEKTSTKSLSAAEKSGKENCCISVWL